MALIYTEISQKSAKSSFLCEYSRILCAPKEEGGDMFWAPAYGPLRMMKHHVRLVIFIRDLRMKIVIAFLFSVDMTI